MLGPAARSQDWIDEVRVRLADRDRLPGRERRASCCRSSQWSETTIGNVPIGQGISVTPIQMASVYAAVANGGVWIQPHLVDRVGGRAPEVWQPPPAHVAVGRRAR